MIKTAHIFPAFVSEYTGKEISSLSKYHDVFTEYLLLASREVGKDLTDFDIVKNNYLDHQLKSQYIQFVFGCTYSDILYENKIIPEYTAGYSMGIYASLYHSKSIDFQTGLVMIKNAFHIIKGTLANIEYGMAVIGGVEMKDVKCIIINNSLNAEVININNQNSYVVSGMKNDIEILVNVAKEEGALHTRIMNISFPYHSTCLNEAALEFGNFLANINIIKPEIKLISSIDQRIIDSEAEVKKELADNINKKINWLKTFNVFTNAGINCFLECGAGESLTKIGKFIDGDFKIYNSKSLSQYFELYQ
jgi:[acyl-carrier-protein] S-malonyltransferase